MNGNRHQTMARLPLLAAAALVWGLAALAAMASPLNENGGPSVRLPPLAEAVQQGNGDGTWRYQGEISGSPVVAIADFDKALRGQGWVLRQSVAMGRAGTPGGERPLVVWAQGDWRLLLLVWPAAPGRSGFALGVLDERKLAADAVRMPVLPPDAKSGYIDLGDVCASGVGGPVPENKVGKGSRKP